MLPNCTKHLICIRTERKSLRLFGLVVFYGLTWVLQKSSEAYLEPSWTSMMKMERSSFVDAWLCSKYASALVHRLLERSKQPNKDRFENTKWTSSFLHPILYGLQSFYFVILIFCYGRLVWTPILTFLVVCRYVFSYLPVL